MKRFPTPHAAVAALLVVHTVAFLWVVGGRLVFPYEIEWMTGSVLDHVERLRAGAPIYVPPGDGFIPFLYPPLYYAIAATLGGGVVAARAVSVAATLVQAWCCERVARGLGASRFWSLVATGIFVASFSYVGFWYDLERCDSLLGAMVALGAWLLIAKQTLPRAVLAGAVLGLAFLAKQQAIFYVAGAAGGLVVSLRARDRGRVRELVAFSVAAGVALAGGVLFARARTGPSFDYYVLQMPRAHGVMLALVADALGRDVTVGFVPVLATLTVIVAGVRGLLRATASRAELVFTAMLGAGFLGAIASRLHIGGWVNVLIPWTTFAAIATAVVLARLRDRAALGGAALLVAQLAVWLYDPNEYVPPRVARPNHAKFAALVRTLEENGPVLVPPRGHVAHERHFHIAALADTARVDGEVPARLRERIARRGYAAVLDDVRPPGETAPTNWPPILLEDFADLGPLFLRNYYVSERIDDDLVQIQLASPALPRWVYRPRRAPLGAETPPAALRERQLREMRLAEDRAAALREGRKAYAIEEIELLAAPVNPSR